MKQIFLVSALFLFTLFSFAKIDLDFSKTRGLYDESFTLLISADQPNTTIKYTTNGSTPSSNNGNTYNGGITINTTSILRVFAYNSSDESNVRTHSYIFYQDVPNQPNSKAGFPDTGFAFDESILNNSTYAQQLDEALLQVGTISIAIDLNDFDDVYNGTLEKKASAEFIIPLTGEHVQEDCGIERFGGSSFNSHKRNFRLSFKSSYGAKKLSFPLFNDKVINEFDQLALRAGHAGCINNEHKSNLYTGESNDLADQVVRDLQINMSENKVGVAGNFMHLYINGIYWGVYNATERPTDGWAQKYFGAEKEDYDVIKTKTALDGNKTQWNTLVNFAANNNLADNSNYQTIQNYINIENFIDYILISNYAPHSDNHHSAKNSFATKNRLLNDGFKFWVWDTEPAFDYYWTNGWTKDHIGSTPFDTIYSALINNADFVMQTADQMHAHCFNDGALSPNKVVETYMLNYNTTDVAMIAEAGRWASSSAYTGFVDAKNRVVNSYLPQRTNETINNYKNAGLYPNLSAVDFSQYGGLLNNGSSISLSNPNNVGSIRYTIDRNDPRASGGALGATAKTYSGNISLPNGVHVIKTRVKRNSEWSAMSPHKFYVGQNYAGLVINEIHYNPEDSIFFNPTIYEMDEISGKSFEFVELKNTSNQAIYLEDVYFNKGITAKFEYNTIIPSGGFVVIAEDAYWFQQKYGFAPDATFAGKLDNGGENLWIVDPFENIIDTLRYDDNLPWDTKPDEGKYSLALINATSDNSNAVNWSVQTIYTTPGAENKFNSDTNPSEHIAIGKPSSQSSTGYGGVSSRAVDGDTKGNWSNRSVTHTAANQTNSWWRVDLEDVYDLSTIKIHNRTGCCTNRIVGASLYAGNINSTNPNDYTLVGALSDLTINSFTNMNISARYIMVRHAGIGTLSLAEVEVHGTLNTDDGGTTNPAEHIAIGKPSSQSSTGYGGVSSRAVDANTSGIYRDRSVTHTAANQTNSWWRVDLEDVYNLSTIKIHNRTGCCTNRIVGASLYVGNTNSTNPNDYTLVGALSDLTINSFTNMNISARYVMVRHAGIGTLSLAEVEVHGTINNAKIGANTIEAVISPNPASNFINIDLQNYDYQNTEYLISSMQGQILLKGVMQHNNNNAIQIDISALQNGVYIIYLNADGKQTAKQKVIVMR